MERDSYWIKSITNNGFGLFGGFFNRHANLGHESISSNQLTIHVHALPTEGRPAHFTGAIGQFKVTGDAQPGSVAIGEPVTLRFTVSGAGNFGYVRCPRSPMTPRGKPTFPRPRPTTRRIPHPCRQDLRAVRHPPEERERPASPASFSYFDPTAKQYVTVPVALPGITVTGSPVPVTAASSGAETDSTTAAATPATTGFLPNRLEIGSPRMSLTPVIASPGSGRSRPA